MSKKRHSQRQWQEHDEEAERSAGSQDRLIEVVQQLLKSQQRAKEEEQARWEQREAELSERRREEQEHQTRLQEAIRQQRRADEEWALWLEELRLRTEALRSSEKNAAESRAAAAERDEKRSLQKRAEKLEPWRDTDLPEAYFTKFERAMTEADIPQAEWASRLTLLLTGKALTAFHKNVPEAAMDSYIDLKEALLEALGLSLEQ